MCLVKRDMDVGIYLYNEKEPVKEIILADL
jgi:hypothetical protein